VGGERKPERGKGEKGKGGDQSPAWSSPDLGTTDGVFRIGSQFCFRGPRTLKPKKLKIPLKI